MKMLKRTIATVFVTALLCLFALPVTALAVGEPATLYVGNQNVKRGTETTYWSTNNSGELTQSAENNAWNVKYDPNSATLTLKNATIEGWYDDVNTSGAGIYAASSSGPVSLNIVLEEENKVSGWYGINVSSGGDASLNISGSGSLTVSGLSGNGIGIFMSSQNSANLTIEEASVTALGSQVGGSGVRLITSQTGSPSLTIEVKGGSLQASGETNGIHFLSNVNDATAVANLKVSGNAMVKASSITTTKDGTGSAPELKPAASGSDGTGGIIWDGKSGTVYGNVTLQEDLEIGEGESLTISDGSSLTIPDDKKLTVNGGALTGDVTGTVIYKVTGVSLNMTELTLTEGDSETLTASIEPTDATNQKVTWSSSAPDVARVDASGNVTAVAKGTATITAATEDGGKTATCTVKVEHAHDPAAAWSSDASGHWHACAGCSEKLNIAAHSGKVVGKRDATCTEAGFTGDTVCSICGYVVAKGVATPAAGHSYQNGVCTACGAKEPAKDEDAIPATGDLAPMACALLGIFGIAFVVAGLRKRTSW
ncbi:Ig-like domain-containing protein [Enorma shizhengliae]|nr:Ig-like domain-containing protein [Enorma shizhengliae]